MKNLCCLLLLVAFATQTFGQTASQPQQVSQEQIDLWKKKAKTNLIVSLSMATVGVGMVIGGIAADANKDPFQEDTPGITVAGIGVLVALGSIPFTVMSGVYRKKARAATVTVTSMKLPFSPAGGYFRVKQQPSLTLSIPLGR
jgi:hypothetical protein